LRGRGRDLRAAEEERSAHSGDALGEEGQEELAVRLRGGSQHLLHNVCQRKQVSGSLN
jgi:hypothetical protein